MKIESQELNLNLPEELGEEIAVKVEFHIENTGIGFYEFWGHKGFDAGENYIEVDNIEPIFTNESEEHQVEIVEYINEKFKTCSDWLIERLDLSY